MRLFYPDIRQKRTNILTDNSKQQLNATITEEYAGLRLDQALAKLFPQFSRSRLQQWVRDGLVTVDEGVRRSKDKVCLGEQIVAQIQLPASEIWQAEPIPLDIVYEDDSLLVINKSADMVVHPAVGNRSGTMVNALLHHDINLDQLPRAGIVHRLDKDTTGLLVVAKTLSAHKSLVEQLQDRAFEREYHAVVTGVITAGGTVDAAIGRHPRQRTHMAVVQNGGKAAITHYRVLEKYRAHTLAKINLETGRTHQIRVHMAHIHFPIVGDRVYGGRLKIPKSCNPEFKQCLTAFNRQALHAAKLGLTHPESGEWMSWRQDEPADMAELIQQLRIDKQPA